MITVRVLITKRLKVINMLKKFLTTTNNFTTRFTKQSIMEDGFLLFLSIVSIIGSNSLGIYARIQSSIDHRFAGRTIELSIADYMLRHNDIIYVVAFQFIMGLLLGVFVLTIRKRIILRSLLIAVSSFALSLSWLLYAAVIKADRIDLAKLVGTTAPGMVFNEDIVIYGLTFSVTCMIVGIIHLLTIRETYIKMGWTDNHG